ncbi:tRNA lysidine(34) synthetase TilS [Chelatococcus reniformis]|nr:tRNA lysidine(34) synthetase TilS [Chelatococcus reniformis]
MDLVAATERLRPLERAPGLLLAVSGGPDSMALLRLVADWARAAGRPRVEVATVDHGLRAESRQECEAVVRWAEAAGLAATILTWEGDKPVGAMQERAREARYRLLAERARTIGASHVVVAHHADDAAETVLLRLLAGSGIAGLAGMAPLSPLDELVLARPLLDVPKERLIATCRAFGQRYVSDPSNADARFLRPRLRRISTALAAEGLDRGRLLRLAARAARADAALRQMTDTACAACAPRATAQGLSFTAAALAAQPAEIVARVLGTFIDAARAAAPGPRAPLRLERLEELARRFADAQARRSPLKSSLAGTILCLDSAGEATILPEGDRRRGRRAGGKTLGQV